MPSTKRVAVIVDDDEMDAFHIRNALADVRPELKTIWFDDPHKALGELPALGELSFVMVDLNMPRQSGLEFLSSLRSMEAGTYPPVIILTSSGQPDDRDAAYRANASAFVQKPGSLAGYKKLAEQCVGFWVDAVELDGNAP